jgi:hypothetical protein
VGVAVPPALRFRRSYRRTPGASGLVAPSLMNAIAAATGKPVRSLPLRNVKLANA